MANLFEAFESYETAVGARAQQPINPFDYPETMQAVSASA